MKTPQREKASELYHQCKYMQSGEGIELIEKAFLEVRLEERSAAIRDCAREFCCSDIFYWKPKEVVKLILSLLPSPEKASSVKDAKLSDKEGEIKTPKSKRQREKEHMCISEERCGKCFYCHKEGYFR